MYDEAIIPIIKNVNVLYHESTLDKNKKLAEPTKHSTAKQAATIKQKANVKKRLIWGIIPPVIMVLMNLRLKPTVFDNVELAEDGKSFESFKTNYFFIFCTIYKVNIKNL
jgi:ribonuclease Z